MKSATSYSPTAPMTPRKYKLGQRVCGVRGNDRSWGTLVETYVTLNNGFRNCAYVVLRERDNKAAVYQCLKA